MTAYLERRLGALMALAVTVLLATAGTAGAALPRPVGGLLAIDVPAPAGSGLFDVDPFRAGTQVLAQAVEDARSQKLKLVSVLDLRLLAVGPAEGFVPRGSLGAGWRAFVWGEDSSGRARLWTPAFDSARSLLSFDPELPCGSAADAATPLAGPFPVTIPRGARPGGQSVPSPTSALVFGDPGDPARGVRIAAEAGVTLGMTTAGANVARGGFGFAGAAFAYGTAGGEPALWTPKLLGTSTKLASSRFLACTGAPPAQGTITLTKQLVPAGDPGRFDLRLDGETIAAGVGDEGTTGVVSVAAGEHTVSEAAAGSTSLDDYTTKIECVEDANGASPVTSTGPVTVPVAAGDEWQCVVTNTIDVSRLAALAVSPGSGPPGSPLLLEPAGGVPPGTLTLYVGGEQAPVVPGGDGALNAVVPMFLDPDTSWSAPPAGPVDVILYADGQPVAGAHQALAVTPLERAPGAADDAVDALSGITSSLGLIADQLAGEPGVDQQWLTSVIGALDELISGSDPSSLAGALAAATPEARELLDAWFASSGMLTALEQYEQQLAGVVDGLSAGQTSRARARLRALLQGAGTPIGDVALATKMQVYEDVKLFGEQVIGATSATWSSYVGTSAGLLNLAFNIPAARVPAAIIGVVLGLTDFTLNKIVLGLMPARLSSMQLTVANPTLQPAATTNATLTIEAENDPPQIGVQDTIGALLTASGLGDLGDWGPKFNDVVLFFLSLIQSRIASYASQHPELNLDTSISSMPHQTWQATITTRSFVNLLSSNANVLAPLGASVDWQASSPSQRCGDDVSIWALTAANTFGTQAAASNHVTVHVDPTNPQVIVSPGFVDLPAGGSQQFTATGAANIQWTASGGTIDQSGSYTAPSASGTYTVTATDAGNPSCKGTATIQVRPTVAITPASITLAPGDMPRSPLPR
jgi:hypothetical protein